MDPLEEIAPNIYLQRHALSMLGCEMGRNVTVIRLQCGQTVVHSTAPFSPTHVRQIREVGEPGWLLDATNFHDTAAAAGVAVLPGVPYFAPEGFSASGLETPPRPLSDAPREWRDELEIIELGGLPKIREHLVYHPASGTLIVADLLFNLPDDVSNWTRGFLRVTSGMKTFPATSRLFRHSIKDKAAFAASVEKVLTLDFEKIIVGHGLPVIEDAKGVFEQMVAELLS